LADAFGNKIAMALHAAGVETKELAAQAGLDLSQIQAVCLGDGAQPLAVWCPLMDSIIGVDFSGQCALMAKMVQEATSEAPFAPGALTECGVTDDEIGLFLEHDLQAPANVLFAIWVTAYGLDKQLNWTEEQTAAAKAAAQERIRQLLGGSASDDVH